MGDLFEQHTQTELQYFLYAYIYIQDEESITHHINLLTHGQ